MLVNHLLFDILKLPPYLWLRYPQLRFVSQHHIALRLLFLIGLRTLRFFATEAQRYCLEQGRLWERVPGILRSYAEECMAIYGESNLVRDKEIAEELPDILLQRRALNEREAHMMRESLRTADEESPL